jgi:tripartite-type tricarboxylate transporter receptor subunit TctC
MKRPRRKFLRLAAGAAVLPVFSRGASAVDYPVRPVRIVVGFPAGGATDVIARLMGQWLSERLGQQFLIENRPGAGGNIAAEAVVKATPDGYTLLQVGTPNAINAALYSNLSFNFIRDIAPVGSAMRISYVIVVHPSVPATTVPEFIAYAKANAGRINMASAGTGIMSRITDLGGVALASSPAEFGRLISDEIEKFGNVIKFAGIKPE